MDMPRSPEVPVGCSQVSEILNMIGDKWTMQVVVSLRERPRRFNDLKRQVGGISQQMLTRTLKSLVRDGMVRRTVCGTTPPQVEYALTEFGQSLSEPIGHLAQWAVTHIPTIHANRMKNDIEP